MASACLACWTAACCAAETATANYNLLKHSQITKQISTKKKNSVITSEAVVLELDAPSSDLDGIVLAYFGCLARISSNDTSSLGWMILLDEPAVVMVATLEPSLLLLGVFVVGGALIVAPGNPISYHKH